MLGKTITILAFIILLVPLQASYGDLEQELRANGVLRYSYYDYEYIYGNFYGYGPSIVKSYYLDPIIGQVRPEATITPVDSWVGIVDNWHDQLLISDSEYQDCLTYLVEKVF